MLTRRIIPCLDVLNGRVVKGIRFQNLRDAGDPVQQALAYARSGADELVVLDVGATVQSRGACLETVRAVRRVLDIPLTVGGGVRSLDDARMLLSAGADKVSINSAAVREPALIAQIADRFGRQCTVVAIDARRAGPSWEILTRSGGHAEARDAIHWAKEAASRGAGELLLTSWDRDGSRAGYDLPLLSAVCAAVGSPVIASGGAGSMQDIAAAFKAGAHAVLAASIFHDGDSTPDTIKHELARVGVEVRL